MPEPAEGPWVASPTIHPGEVRGPHGPVAYVSLAVPIAQRHTTVSVLAAGLEMLAALEAAAKDPGLYLRGVAIETRFLIRDAIAKAKGE